MSLYYTGSSSREDARLRGDKTLFDWLDLFFFVEQMKSDIKVFVCNQIYPNKLSSPRRRVR